MKTTLPLVLTTFTALLLAGCETSGTSTRIQEKPATYAALSPQQQQAIKAGELNVGYTTDMVYLSLGKPSEINLVETADGLATVWTYKKFYPTAAVVKLANPDTSDRQIAANSLVPSTLEVTFYGNQMFEVAIERWNQPFGDGIYTIESLADHPMQNDNQGGLLGPGPAVPPVSTPPGATPITPPSPTP